MNRKGFHHRYELSSIAKLLKLILVSDKCQSFVLDVAWINQISEFIFCMFPPKIKNWRVLWMMRSPFSLKV